MDKDSWNHQCEYNQWDENIKEREENIREGVKDSYKGGIFTWRKKIKNKEKVKRSPELLKGYLILIKSSVVGRIIAHQWHQSPNPGDLWIC